jgi:hypothetical protein
VLRNAYPARGAVFSVHIVNVVFCVASWYLKNTVQIKNFIESMRELKNFPLHYILCFY